MDSRKFILLFSCFLLGLGLVLGVFVLLGTSYLVAQAAPVELFVKADGTGTDCTQTSPCPLETAMEQSIDGDTIYIATGEYTGTGPSVITVTKSISLTGGWDGNPTGDLDINPTLYPTILDGEDTRKVIKITGDITPTLSGLRVSHGYDDSGAGGAGIHSDSAHPNILGCQIYNNSARYNGGLYLRKSHGATLIESDIYGNIARNGFGGGVGIRDSSDVVFMDNKIYSNMTAGTGGGIFIYNGNQVTLSGQEIFSNTVFPTGIGGGGIYISTSSVEPQGDVLIHDSRIYNNFVSFHGGGIYAQNILTLTINSTDIYDHDASQGGGIYVNGVNHTTLAGNDIHDNFSDSNGGGLYLNNGGFISMGGNWLYNNQAGSSNGGGMYASDFPAVELDGNLIFSNTAYGTGGVYVQYTPVITITDNEIYSNTATNWDGGGLNLSWVDSAIVTGNSVRDNTTNVNGGGVMMFNCSECILEGNTIFDNESRTGKGGGVCLQSSENGKFRANHLNSNTAHGSGGGIYVEDVNNVEIQNNTVTNNEATRTNSHGGGIALSGSQPAVIAGNIISGNSVTGNGGGIGLGGSNDVVIASNKIYQNDSVDDHGGGLWFGSSRPVTMENNMVFGNQVPPNKFGSGIYALMTNLYLRHNTIADNTGGFAQGLYALGSVDPSKIWMTNNIFAYQDQGFVYGINSAITATHTLFYGNASNYIGTGSLISTNEFIGSPEFLDPAHYDYHISEGSAALDIGLEIPGLEVDIDGDPRPRGLGYDIGADELVIESKIYLPLVIK